MGWGDWGDWSDVPQTEHSATGEVEFVYHPSAPEFSRLEVISLDPDNLTIKSIDDETWNIIGKFKIDLTRGHPTESEEITFKIWFIAGNSTSQTEPESASILEARISNVNPSISGLVEISERKIIYPYTLRDLLFQYDPEYTLMRTGIWPLSSGTVFRLRIPIWWYKCYPITEIEFVLHFEATVTHNYPQPNAFSRVWAYSTGEEIVQLALLLQHQSNLLYDMVTASNWWDIVGVVLDLKDVVGDAVESGSGYGDVYLQREPVG